MSDPRSTRLLKWCSLPAALAVAFLLYARTLDHPYISDDKGIIAANPTLDQPSWRALAAIPRMDYWSAYHPSGKVIPLGNDHNLYRPVTILTYWLGARIDAGLHAMSVGRADPALRRRVGFRAVNVALHGWAAWMVGLWCARLLRSRGRAGDSPRPAAWGALAAGVVVLVHPVATDVVNRIVGRADILTLLSVAGFLAVKARATARGWTVGDVVVASLWALVAFGSKESGLMLIPLALVQAWVTLPAPPTPGEPGGAAPRFSRWRVGLAPILLTVPLSLYVVGRYLAGIEPPSYQPDPNWDLLQNPLIGKGLAERLPSAAALTFGHLKTLFWPHPLIAFDVPFVLPRWSDAAVIIGVVSASALLLAFLVLALRRHPLALAAAWALATCFIVSQVVAPIGVYTEVRLVYPLLGALGLAAGWWAAAAMRRRAWAARALPALLLALCVVAGGTLVQQRNSAYRTELDLLLADFRQRPDNPATVLRLANQCEEQGRLFEARAHFRRATELAPQSPQAWCDWAIYERRRDNTGQAIALYQHTLELNALHPLALMDLGLLLWILGDAKAGGTFLYMADQESRDNPDATYNLASYEASEGMVDQAKERLERLVDRRPDYAPAVQLLEKLRQGR